MHKNKYNTVSFMLIRLFFDFNDIINNINNIIEMFDHTELNAL